MKNNQAIKVVADEYTIISDKKMVFALSNYNIPCEVSKLPLDMRHKTNSFIKEIKGVISLLEIDEDEILVAHYLDVPSKKKYHLENVLFYNLGSKIFKENCRNGLAFGELDNKKCSELIQKFSIENRYTYAYLYECKKARDSKDKIDKEKIWASWKDVVIDDIGIKENTIAGFWKSLREQADLVQILETGNENLNFGIEVQLSLPKRINLPLYLKSIVDGIICAFHAEEGKTKRNISKLYRSIGQPEIEFEKNCHVLGSKEYLRFYEDKSSYRWFPDGHRCRFFIITIDDSASIAKFSGKIFKWEK